MLDMDGLEPEREGRKTANGATALEAEKKEPRSNIPYFFARKFSNFESDHFIHQKRKADFGPECSRMFRMFSPPPAPDLEFDQRITW